MYNWLVIRKQLYLRQDQDRLLKKMARELGVPEAEVVRRALDRFLSGAEASARPGAEAAALEFLEEAQRLAAEHRFPEDWQFDREELYAERGRWGR